MALGALMRAHKWIFVLVASFAFAQVGLAEDHWFTTWTAAPQQGRGGGPPPAPPAGAAGQRGQAGPAPAPAPTTLNDQTVRMIIRPSVGGRRARVTLSNAYGNASLKVGAAHIAIRSKESEIVPPSD